jgi:glycosyltransferase involved in cell wall biosynthesis
MASHKCTGYNSARRLDLKPYPFSLSVVIMAFNEEATIEQQVVNTLAFLSEWVKEGEVIAVDDGSTDRTGKILDALAKQDPRLKVVHHPRNLGMGVAIKSGYRTATMDFVTQLPGDAQVSPDTLIKFLPLVQTHDLVLSTYERRDDGLLRFFVTRAYWACAYAILHNPCKFTGTMVFRRSLLDRIAIKSDTFMVNVEVPLKLMKLGVKPAFVTIQAKERAFGRSRVLSLRTISKVLREMLMIREELRRL